MPIKTLLSELDRKVILFSFEKREQAKFQLPFSFLNDEYRTYILTKGEYILWELEKRKLLEAEVIAHSWMVTSKENVSLIFQFKEGNELCLQGLFSDQAQNGRWLIKNGILKVQFSYKGHAYDISIIANNNRSIHSALQITDDYNVDLLKVVAISDAKYGKSLIE
jgi:hypothetical protein